MPTKHQADGPPRLQRALFGFPILAMAILMARAFAMAGPTVPVVAEMLEAGRFELGGVSVPVLKTFYGIPLLDEVFAGISLSFVQLQSMVDPAIYWQTLVLLTEYVGVYAIMLFESSRLINKSTVFQFPSVANFLAQLAGGGLVPNVYHYFYHIFRPIQRAQADPTQWKLDGAVCASVLPSLIVGYYVPHFLGYLHPSLEARHWWSWVWQLFPVWVGVLTAVLSRAMRLSPSWRQWLDSHDHAFTMAKYTGFSIAAVNGVVDGAMLVTSGIPLRDMFLPKYLLQNPDSFTEALRAILQYDQICCFGGALLWLIYIFADAKAARICDSSWAQLGLLAIITAPFMGLSTFIIVAWLMREQMIVFWIKDQVIKKE